METGPHGSSPWTNIAIIGPAQHGKSTLAGFLLYAVHEVDPKVMSEAEKAARARGDLSRKFAFLLDRKPHERTTNTGKGRGMTQETSWWGFERRGRPYLLMDSPGQYSRVSHVVGALSEADAAVLVVDIQDYLEALERPEVWRDRHGQVIPSAVAQVRAYLSVARFYGVKRLVVALHKMDKVGFSERDYHEVKTHLELTLEELDWDMNQACFVPTAVRAVEEEGYNVIEPGSSLRKWYKGPTFIQALEQLRAQAIPVNADFRMQVNYVYQGSRVRVPGYELVITGKVFTGTVQLKDELLIQPSGIQCRVRSIQSIDRSKAVERKNRWDPQSRAVAGEIVGLGCTIMAYGRESEVETGEIVGPVHSPSHASDQLKAELIVLHLPPLADLLSGRLAGKIGLGYFSTGSQIKSFSLDEGSTWQRVKRGGETSEKVLLVEDIVQQIDEGSTLPVELSLAKPAPLDVHIEGTDLGRFVLLDPNLFLVCGGHVTEAL